MIPIKNPQVLDLRENSLEGSLNKHSLVVNFLNVAKPPSSPIQTLLSALESHQILPIKGSRAFEIIISHHRRSGISPCPEDRSYLIFISLLYIEIPTMGSITLEKVITNV